MHYPFFKIFIWDSADRKEDFINAEKLLDQERKRFRIMFNLDMLNGLICIILSFFVPKIAFFFLFFKVPILFFMTIYITNERRKDMHVKKAENSPIEREK
ncbi:MAG: hypothetical protein WDM90_19610 [Ferruginibacter sp.]